MCNIPFFIEKKMHFVLEKFTSAAVGSKFASVHWRRSLNSASELPVLPTLMLLPETHFPFYDPPSKVRGSLWFCLVRQASVPPASKKNGLKHVLGGFEYVFGVFGDFDFRPSARPSGKWMGYVLCRKFVLGLWGLEFVHLLFWTSVSTVGLSERGLNVILHVALRQYAMFCAENLS